MPSLMPQPDSTRPHLKDLSSLLENFMALADRLAMPSAERAGIIGISEAELRLMSRFGNITAPADPATVARRISYAMPLMNKIVEADSPTSLATPVHAPGDASHRRTTLRTSPVSRSTGYPDARLRD